ncbi:hypothetical protein PoB_006180700 [Plakobranchus ocellatus]|uniref:Uncharacterized protein n=1 Tax=Plakobranchus ocellatus TaxID=259542 RepID=A0AAV4CTT7_9GAST|nr:hypothetical protein PoB_006180700 [Plakobranchus ocellatus]
MNEILWRQDRGAVTTAANISATFLRPAMQEAETRLRCLTLFYDAEVCYIASLQQGDLRLSGPSSGQGAGGEARTHDRKIPSASHCATDAPLQRRIN